MTIFHRLREVRIREPTLEMLCRLSAFCRRFVGWLFLFTLGVTILNGLDITKKGNPMDQKIQNEIESSIRPFYNDYVPSFDKWIITSKGSIYVKSGENNKTVYFNEKTLNEILNKKEYGALAFFIAHESSHFMSLAGIGIALLLYSLFLTLAPLPIHAYKKWSALYFYILGLFSFCCIEIYADLQGCNYLKDKNVCISALETLNKNPIHQYIGMFALNSHLTIPMRKALIKTLL